MTPVREWLRWITYRRAAGLVVQTRAVAERISSSRAGLPPIAVIPNPVLPAAATATRAHTSVPPYLYEGFPNGLREALACGSTTIATDCPSGPRETLEGGRLGMLVPCEDPAAIAAAVTNLEKNAALRARLGQIGPSVLERFGLDPITGVWEHLLQQAAAS
jgi:hypothetical protein